jgi:DmsE family decaheme c-type cytochrome
MEPRRWKLLIVPFGAAAVLALSGLGGAAPRTAAAPKAAQAPPPAVAQASSAPLEYVGSDTCAACHGDVSEHLAGTPHGKSGFAKLSDLGCETCHGPGSAHAEDPDNPALHPRVDKLPVRQQSQVCTTCHKGGSQFFWKGSHHETRGLSCVTCHSVHSPKTQRAQLKTATEMEQCFSCHKDTRAETWKTSHHPIREGKVSCSDCHNPHGSATPKMIRAASVNDQCYTCHTEKRGPFLWEHPPVRENCLNCHTPHGSNHLKLQKTSVPYICQQCHANTRHPGTLYDGFRVPTLEDPARGSNRLFNRACLDCHAAVHGSNHPSSTFLGH